MVLPIIGYGDPVLRKVGEDITPDYPELKALIANMYDTMRHAYGVGLAAPQVGLAIRLFVVDASPFAEDDDLTAEEQAFLKTFKKLSSMLKSPKKQVINGISMRGASVFQGCVKM